tara:strand:- start:1753 stop:2088 length:336 start_codon:yes stop_codon:yes gene_type:complete
MPHYDYGCNHCGFHQSDVYQSIKDKELKKCPRCKKNTFSRIIYGGLGFFVSKEPSTIGQLADKNAQANKTKISENEAKKRESQPQEQDRSHIRKINKMTPEQRHKWIMEGD